MVGNLVAFGCSLTFGHGLPDCHVPPDEPGPNPSVFAWPSRLAEMTNRRCVNLSRPGASNLQIALSVMSYRFQPGDVGFILWSYPDRGLIIHDDQSYEQLGHWADSRKFQAWTMVNTEQTKTTSFWFYAVSVDSWLVRHGVEFHALTIGMRYYTGRRPEWANGLRFLDANIQKYRNEHPKALDGRHPGPEGHEAMARQVAAEIGWI